MSAQTPAGWYPDPAGSGRQRYWDGERWTEQFSDQSGEAAREPAASPQATSPKGEAAASAAPANGKRPWYRRGWFIAVAALLVGIILGSAAAGEADPKSTPEYKALESKLADASAENDATAEELSATEEELSTTQADLEQAQADAETALGDIPEREEAIEAAEADLKKRSAKLADKETSVAKQARSVLAREKKVGLVEKAIARNTVGGDGVYQVGVDMRPGTYKAAPKPNCYYAALGDANGNNILSNNITSGPAVVNVGAGQFFETQGCGDWVLQP